MIAHEYYYNELKVKYGIDFRLEGKQVPVNTVSGTDMLIHGNYQPEKGLVIAAAFAFPEKVRLFLRTGEQDADFVRAIKQVLEHCANEKYELVAINSITEQGNFAGMLRREYKVKEINDKGARMPFMVSWMTNRNIKFPQVHPDGMITIKRWQEFVLTNMQDKLVDVVDVCLNSLLRDIVIIQNYAKMRPNIKTI